MRECEGAEQITLRITSSYCSACELIIYTVCSLLGSILPPAPIFNPSVPLFSGDADLDSDLNTLAGSGFDLFSIVFWGFVGYGCGWAWTRLALPGETLVGWRVVDSGNLRGLQILLLSFR